jgi:hypothetical protein
MVAVIYKNQKVCGQELGQNAGLKPFPQAKTSQSRPWFLGREVWGIDLR